MGDGRGSHDRGIDFAGAVKGHHGMLEQLPDRRLDDSLEADRNQNCSRYFEVEEGSIHIDTVDDIHDVDHTEDHYNLNLDNHCDQDSIRLQGKHLGQNLQYNHA